MARIVVKPVTDTTWPPFEALFSARGCPHFCWCTPYRFREARTMSGPQKRAAVRALVSRGVPLGVLAFDGHEPVGWCSVAPRETYAKLDRSKTMPKVDDGAWTILCFFVRRDHRGQGVTRALIEGALRFARVQGARVVEGYPFDTVGISSTHRGHSRVFKGTRFEREGRRWVRRLRGKAPANVLAVSQRPRRPRRPIL